jgi:hypothetical protein
MSEELDYNKLVQELDQKINNVVDGKNYTLNDMIEVCKELNYVLSSMSETLEEADNKALESMNARCIKEGGVTVTLESARQVPAITKWCGENIESEWSSFGRHFWFSNESEADLFLLRWA